MDFLGNLQTGFAVAITPGNLLYCAIGAILGTAIGVLPGLGPPATIALLLPVTFTLEATSPSSCSRASSSGPCTEDPRRPSS